MLQYCKYLCLYHTTNDIVYMLPLLVLAVSGHVYSGAQTGALAQGAH